MSAHGADVEVTNESVTLTRTGLAAALHGDGTLTVPVADITGVTLTEPTEFDMGSVQLDGAGERIRFAPNHAEQARALAEDLRAALRGQAPGDGAVTGLDFVAVDVETANRSFGSICQVGAARFVDGRLAESKQWLCRPPAGLDEFEDANVAVHGITADAVADAPRFADIFPEVAGFLSAGPLLAHNAQFDATALRDAAERSGIETPQVLFGCSLALARAARLGVLDHRLPTLAEEFRVELSRHHEAEADALAAGGVLVALARRCGHRGSLLELFHSRGFTLGEIAGGKVTPVLRDRSGAGRTLQAQGVTSPAPQARLAGDEKAATGAGTDFRDPAASASEPTGDTPRGPAPWQAVATPDEVPEPSPAADANHPLYGEHVTLTGDFEPFDKGRLWQAIADHGGQVGKNVTKKTTVLVVGAWGSKTSKEKKAEQYREKGQDIDFWDAEKLFSVLGLNDEPPF